MRETFVLDSSVTLAWCYHDEATVSTDELRDSLVSECDILVPRLYLEVANALHVGERRKRIAPAETQQFLDFLERLPIGVDGQTERLTWNNSLELARQHKLSVYDAAYLELARRKGIALATLDRPLRDAAAKSDVNLRN